MSLSISQLFLFTTHYRTGIKPIQNVVEKNLFNRKDFSRSPAVKIIKNVEEIVYTFILVFGRRSLL